MLKVDFVEKTIGELFYFKKGTNKINKKIIENNKGNFPVYSGSTENKGLMGYIDYFDYDGHYLRIITVGNAGETTELEGKFSLAQNNGVLIPKNTEIEKYISFKYLKYIFNIILPKLAKGADTGNKQRSLTNELLLNANFCIPVDKEGKFNLEEQEKIAEKYRVLEEKKEVLKEKLNYINSVEINFFNNEINNSYFKIKDIFDLSVKTNSSKFTKTFIKNNEGNIPVYGASKDNLPSYGYIKDNAVISYEENGNAKSIEVIYFENCLTYNIDGLAGYIFYREGKFSLSEKVRPLIIKDKFKTLLNPFFLRYLIEPIFRSNVKGRLAENGKNEYTKLYQNMIENIKVPLPIDKKGNIDLEKQNEIMLKYNTLMKIKKNLNEQLEKILNAEINFNIT